MEALKESFDAAAPTKVRDAETTTTASDLFKNNFKFFLACDANHTIDEAHSRNLLKAARNVERAMAFLKECPDAASYLWNRAARETEAERQFSFYWFVEDMRRVDFSNANGGRVRIQNELIPCIARIYLREHPESKPYIKLCPSIFDEVMKVG